MTGWTTCRFWAVSSFRPCAPAASQFRNAPNLISLLPSRLSAALLTLREISADGKGSINHDRLGPFHRTLAGHSLNYITRGTYWGTEQRQQTQAPMVVGPGSSPQKYRNNCGIGGEDCSLCMVSSIAPAYWIRWMILSESADEDIAYLARGAPRRWYKQTQPFGISQAPTRFGQITYTMQVQPDGSVRGSVRLLARPGVAKSSPPLVTVKIRSADASKPLLGTVTLEGTGTELVAWHAKNETAVIKLGSAMAFNFTAS